MPLALVERLAARGIETPVLSADGLLASADPHGRAAPWRDLHAGDVVVARTRHRLALALLRAATRPGVAVLTPWRAIARVRNKARAAQLLAEHRIPTPVTLLCDAPGTLARLPRERFPLLLKPHLGDNAQGLVLVRDPEELGGLDWEDGIVLAQEYVDAGAVDLKLYAAGDRIWAVRRRSPLAAGPVEDPGVRVEPAAEHVELVRACRDAFGLDLMGVDVLETSDGPLVVDVNEFPNYTGVEEAPDVIAELVAAALEGATA